MFIPRRGEQAGYRDAVPEPLRNALRPLSLVLMLAGLVCLVLLFRPGPFAVAEALGATCEHSRHSGPEECGWWDAADLLWTGFWVLTIGGAVLRLTTRPKDRGPRVLDLRKWRS